MRPLMIVSLLIAFAGACTSAAPETAPRPAHRVGTLTRAELDTQHGRKLADAIRTLDAGLLANRGEEIQVWIDGSSFPVARLETLSADDVAAVTRLSAADARQMFGDRANGAGLVVRTRGGNSP